MSIEYFNDYAQGLCDIPNKIINNNLSKDLTSEFEKVFTQDMNSDRISKLVVKANDYGINQDDLLVLLEYTKKSLGSIDFTTAFSMVVNNHLANKTMEFRNDYR